MSNPDHQSDDLQQANAELRRRLAEMEQRLAEMQQQLSLLDALVENSPSNISVINLEKRILLCNRAGEVAMGRPRAEFVGKTQYELFGEEVVSQWDVSDRQVIESRTPLAVENVMPLADGSHTFLSVKFPLIDADGEVYAIGNVVTDITDQKRAEQERTIFQQQIIDTQQAMLRELSTPLVPIADGVVAMPLVGTINSERAQQIIETLLEGISERHAETAILDITGVKVVDTYAAQALVRAAQAAGLLGARVVITGIQSDVAQSLVQIGADLSRIVTRSDLQAGIAYALRAK
jgi:PAS domain S-box-containing protein